MRKLHVRNYLAVMCERREMAFQKWRKSGYRDSGAWNEFITFRDVVMQVLSKARTYP